MNKQLIVLSLFATTGLLGKETLTPYPDNPKWNDSPCCCEMEEDDCCYDNSCCDSETYCIPQQNCTDYECYTPAFYNCNCGFIFDAAFLYWYARETNLSYGLTVQAKERTVPNGSVATPTLVFAPQKYNHLDTRWDPGFRVGMGFSSGCDGWDYYLNWTYFTNKRKNTSSVPNFELNGFQSLAADGQSLLLNPWVNASFHGLDPEVSILTFDKIAAKWQLTFNSVDLEFGRKYWLSRCFTMRPYIGLRGAWDKIRFQTTSSRVTTMETGSSVDTLFKDRFKTRNWGVGLLGGFQPNFSFGCNFILYGNVDLALIWGEFEVKKRENYSRLFCNQVGQVVIDTIDPSYSNLSRSKFFQMNAILDLAIGFRWEESWCCNQYRTALDIGWEHHIWFDHNHRNKTSDLFVASSSPNVNGFRSYDEAIGNLGYGGLVVRLRFDF